jgi:NAD(P)-dependent dehydrogenase (short-subunit alcohol dehydrogenase family)
MRLQGKTALVTGVTSDSQTICQAGGEAHVVVANLTKDQDIDHLDAQTQQVVGPLDILVNNAGMFPIHGARQYATISQSFRFGSSTSASGMTQTTSSCGTKSAATRVSR